MALNGQGSKGGRPAFPTTRIQILAALVVPFAIALYEALGWQIGHSPWQQLLVLGPFVAVCFWGGLWPGLFSAAIITAYVAVIDANPDLSSHRFETRGISNSIIAGVMYLLCALVFGIAVGRLRKSRIETYDALQEARREADQRKAAERESASISVLHNLVVESALDAIVAMDGEGRITMWNAEAERLFGWHADEINGQELARTIVPERMREAHRKGLKKFLENRVGPILGKRLEMSALTRFGGEIPVELIIVHHNAHGGDVFVGFMHDITERKAAEDAIRGINSELEQRVAQRTAELVAANKELEAFSHSVSHDLRAPLRSINGFCAAIESEYGSCLDEAGLEYLNRVRRASERMGELIEDLLKLSRVSRQEMKFEEVDLSRMASEIAKELQLADSERIATFQIEEGLTAHGDERLLRIVMENLLENAWKFTSKNLEPVKIQFGKEMRGERPYFYVRDNGAGFNMEYSARLFGPFNRLHSADEFAGNGIGLATVQRIVERHGGDVFALGEEGRGATFYWSV